MSKPTIKICLGSSCFSRGNEENVAVLEKFMEQYGLKDEIDLEMSGSLCLGRCAEGPIVMIDDTIYTGVGRGVMLDILKKTFPNAVTKEAK